MKKANGVWDQILPLLTNIKMWFGAISVLFGGVYVTTMATGQTNLGLSDSLLFSADTLAITQSPGYPLYIFILHFFQKIPIFQLDNATKGHLVSVLLGSLSCSLVFSLCLFFYDLLKKTSNSSFVLLDARFERWFLALVTTFSYGFSGLVWRYNLFVERQALTSFLLLLWLWLLLRAIFSPKVNIRYWVISFAILGLGLSHQWIFICLLPITIYLIYKNFNRLPLVTLVWSGLVFTISLVLPFSLLWLFLGNQIAYSWQLDGSLQGLFNFISTNYLGDGQAMSSNPTILLSQTDIRSVFTNLRLIIINMMSSMSWWISPIIVLSIIHNQRNSKQGSPYRIISGLTVSMIIGLALVFNWHPTRVAVGDAVRQLVPLHIGAILLVWFGLWEGIKRFGSAGSLLLDKKKISVTLLLSLVTVAGLIIRDNVATAPLKGKVMAQELYKQTLNSLEKDSLLVCFTEASCQGLTYQLAQGVRTDVQVVPFYYSNGNINFDPKPFQTFDYKTYPNLLIDIITTSVHKQPVYAMSLFDQYYNLLGVDNGFINIIPFGYYVQFTHQIPDNLPTTNYDSTKYLAQFPVAYWDADMQNTYSELAYNHIRNARIYLKTNLRQIAYEESNVASSLVYKLFPKQQADFQATRKGVESLLPSEFFALGTKAKSADFVMKEVDKLLERKRIFTATKIAQGAVLLEPWNIQARLKWAGLLAETLASQSALIEYNNVLKLDSGNKQALESIKTLESL